MSRIVPELGFVLDTAIGPIKDSQAMEFAIGDVTPVAFGDQHAVEFLIAAFQVEQPFVSAHLILGVFHLTSSVAGIGHKH